MSSLLDTLEEMLQYHICKHTHRIWTDDDSFSAYACDNCLIIIEEMLNTLKPEAGTISESRVPATRPSQIDFNPLATEKYVPQVGDCVSVPNLTYDIKVTAVGKKFFLGTYLNGYLDEKLQEGMFSLQDNWTRVDTNRPIPDVWVNLYEGDRDMLFGTPRTTREECETKVHKNRIAMLHIWTDEDAGDLVEIIRPT